MLDPVKVNRVQATFRLNSQVAQMIAIILLALAVPLALVALGIKQFSSKKETSPVPEIPGLRFSLELAAEKNFRPPETMPEARDVFLFSQAAGDKSSSRKNIEETARKLKGIVVTMPPGEKNNDRILVQVSEAQATAFEAQALRGFVRKTRGESVKQCRMYEIQFPAP